MLTLQEIERLFVRSDGNYVFARWGRPIAPVAFGVLDETLSIINNAIKAVCLASNHSVGDLDPEFGSNLMFFFCKDWNELYGVPDLDQMIPNLKIVLERLKAEKANQYRVFRFDETGAIQACFVLLRMDEDLQKLNAESFALLQVVKIMLLWSDLVFQNQSPLVVLDTGVTTVRPEIVAVLKAAYDPIMPPQSNDPSHAMRIEARIRVC
ncbi:MAG: hypothetical protein P8L40_05580 [Planktomarina sp.]|nr:hypothetical protein [Planktomarina sp.]